MIHTTINIPKGLRGGRPVMPTIFEKVVTSKISWRKMKHKPTLGRVTSREMVQTELVVAVTMSQSEWEKDIGSFCLNVSAARNLSSYNLNANISRSALPSARRLMFTYRVQNESESSSFPCHRWHSHEPFIGQRSSTSGPPQMSVCLTPTSLVLINLLSPWTHVKDMTS
ncbi:hypothetical protein JOM56_004748 [Amanita muscaria]